MSTTKNFIMGLMLFIFGITFMMFSIGLHSPMEQHHIEMMPVDPCGASSILFVCFCVAILIMAGGIAEIGRSFESFSVETTTARRPRRVSELRAQKAQAGE